MRIEHVRIANVCKLNRQYCISHVYIDGSYSHDTIEDLDRGLDEGMTTQKIASLKVKTRTAIPTGHYTVRMDTVSPTFGVKEYYRNFCAGKLPRLDPVKGYSGILIHRGATEYDSSGCVIVGKNTEVGRVTDSQAVFENLYRRLKEAADRGERIEYIITRKYKA